MRVGDGDHLQDEPATGRQEPDDLDHVVALPVLVDERLAKSDLASEQAPREETVVAHADAGRVPVRLPEAANLLLAPHDLDGTACHPAQEPKRRGARHPIETGRRGGANRHRAARVRPAEDREPLARVESHRLGEDGVELRPRVAESRRLVEVRERHVARLGRHAELADEAPEQRIEVVALSGGVEALGVYGGGGAESPHGG